MAANGMRALGYSWILLDDCWSATTRDAKGNLQPDPARFPSGIPALVEYVQSKGFQLGLYTCAGNTTCKYGRPGSYGYYQQDANQMAAWGVEYVKADNCAHPDENSQIYYTQFSQALNHSSKPIWFSTCQWGNDNVWTWGGSIAQSFRIGPDHLPVWSWPSSVRILKALSAIPRDSTTRDLLLSATEPAHAPHRAAVQALGLDADAVATYDARLRLRGTSADVRKDGAVALLARMVQKLEAGLGQGTADIIQHMADVSNYTRPYGFDDPDFLMTDLWFLTPHDDSVTEASFWALWSGNFIFAVDPRNMTADRASILLNEELIAISQDSLVVAGTRLVQYPNNLTEIWTRPLANGDLAVILYNPSDDGSDPLTVGVSWAQLGWPANAVVSVRDIWAHTTHLGVTGGYQVSLESHCVAFLRLTRTA